MTPRAVVSGWFASRILVARVYTSVEDARYLPIYLYAKEDKKEPAFRSAQACQPSTYERAHSSSVPLATAAVVVTTRLWPIVGRCPVVV